MQMATSVVANEFLGHGAKAKSKPRPFKTERVGHPEKPNQFLGVDVLQWYHPIMTCRKEENAEGWPTRPERVGHPEKLNQFPSIDVLEWYHSIVPILQQENCERVAHPRRCAQ